MSLVGTRPILPDELEQYEKEQFFSLENSADSDETSSGENNIAYTRKLSLDTCEICGFNYLNYYGEVGKDYIEIHHIKPLYQGERFPDPQTDMISVCANCHRMLHRNKYSTLSPEELKHLIVSQDNN